MSGAAARTGKVGINKIKKYINIKIVGAFIYKCKIIQKNSASNNKNR